MTTPTVIIAPKEEPRAPDGDFGQPLRALHARLLENAALRRKRGLERLRSQRMEDAGYWL